MGLLNTDERQSASNCRLATAWEYVDDHNLAAVQNFSFFFFFSFYQLLLSVTFRLKKSNVNCLTFKRTFKNVFCRKCPTGRLQHVWFLKYLFFIYFAFFNRKELNKWWKMFENVYGSRGSRTKANCLKLFHFLAQTLRLVHEPTVGQKNFDLVAAFQPNLGFEKITKLTVSKMTWFFVFQLSLIFIFECVSSKYFCPKTIQPFKFSLKLLWKKI